MSVRAPTMPLQEPPKATAAEAALMAVQSEGQALALGLPVRSVMAVMPEMP